MGEIDEAELLSAGQRGAVLDGMADGRKRIVQAAVLRRCCHELKDRIDPRGLRLANAVVPGELDRSGLVVVAQHRDPARPGAVLDLRCVPDQVFQEHMTAMAQ
jgi:hypothetical protein